jgi:hypothetical protein
MGVRKLKLGSGFSASLQDLKIDSEQLNDVLEYFRAEVVESPEIFPQVPGLPNIRRAKIPKYNLNVWFGFNDTTVELLEIEDPDLLN